LLIWWKNISFWRLNIDEQAKKKKVQETVITWITWTKIQVSRMFKVHISLQTKNNYMIEDNYDSRNIKSEVISNMNQKLETRVFICHFSTQKWL
jgi:hypothetical protein